MKRVGKWLLLTCMMGLLLSGCKQSVEAAEEQHLPARWQGMQTTGKAAMLTIRVEFQDVKFQDGIYSENQLLAMIDGKNVNTEFPDAGLGQYESLQAYYKRSSYGKLTISTAGRSTAEKVYSYTLSKNREDYAGEEGEDALIKEVLSGLDGAIDYQDYDLDDDGYIDGICINFAGQNEERDSTWWSHVRWYCGLSKAQSSSEAQENDNWDGVKAAEYMFFHTQLDAESNQVRISDDEGHRTLIHETGHMLGLDDYYNIDDGSNGIQTEDMMCYNEGEHNGFSKWLLGWIDEEQILWITKEDVDENGLDIQLTPISTENPSATDQLIAVIAPEKEEENAMYSEYFVVEYDVNGLGNHAGETGFRVFHVDAHLNEDGNNFLYTNGNGSGNRLIYAVALMEDEVSRDAYFTDGEMLTPDTVESTAFYGGDVKGFTGISLTAFQTATENAKASFHVSFEEKEVIDGTLEFEADREKIGNMGRVILTANKPLSLNFEQTEKAYLKDASGKKYPVSVNPSYSDAYQVEVIYTDYQENPLKPNTTYTLVLPKGLFQIDDEVYSEECQMVLKTDSYPEIIKNYTYPYEENDVVYSNLFSLGENKSAKLRIKQKAKTWEAIMYTFSETKEESETYVFAYPEAVSDTKDVNVNEVKAWQGQDGSIFAAMYAYVEGKQEVYVYWINQNVRTKEIEPYVMEESVTFLTTADGLKAISNQPNAEDTVSVYTIDSQTEPGYVTAQKKLSFPAEEINIYALTQNTYAIVSPSVKVEVYDAEDQLLYSLSNFDWDLGVVYAVTKTEDGIAVLHFLWDEGLEEVGVAVSLFDENGSFVETKKLAIDTSAAQNWNFEPTSFGYHITLIQQDMSAVHYFTNAGFEILSYLETSASDGAMMGKRFAYSGNTINGTVISVTESVLKEENNEDGSNTENKPDNGEGSTSTNKPENEEGSGTGNKPENGEGSGTGNKPESEEGSTSTNKSNNEEKKDQAGNADEKQNGKTEHKQEKKPATGDESRLLLWLGIAVVSVFGIEWIKKKKYQK